LRAVTATFALGLALLVARRASADPPKAACVHAAEEGQRLRAESKLREARESFTACAAERCPALIRSDCSGWLAEVEAAVPTVVIRAIPAESQGRELYEVEVRVDGVVQTSKLDGRELPVNPGEHHFSFSAPGRVPAEDDIVIRVGEKHRLLTVSLFSVNPPPPPVIVKPVIPAPPPPRVGTAAKVLLIGGGVALAGGIALGTTGLLKERSLRRTCAPNCDPDDVDSARLTLRLADVSLLVGAAAVAAAGVLIWTRPDGNASVGVTPLAGGAMVGVRFGSHDTW
jgi:hypothetical protein